MGRLWCSAACYVHVTRQSKWWLKIARTVAAPARTPLRRAAAGNAQQLPPQMISISAHEPGLPILVDRPRMSDEGGGGGGGGGGGREGRKGRGGREGGTEGDMCGPRDACMGGRAQRVVERREPVRHMLHWLLPPPNPRITVHAGLQSPGRLSQSPHRLLRP
jgi:hypothetical protein